MTSDPQSNDFGRERLPDHHSQKRLNPWRCLSLLRFGAYAIIGLLVVEGFEQFFLCEIWPPESLDTGCPAMGPWLSGILIGVILISVIACASQGWHDFSKLRRRERRRRRSS